MTHRAYLELPELTPAAIRDGAALARASDETLAVALTLLVSSALGHHPAEHAVRIAVGQPFEGASDVGLPDGAVYGPAPATPIPDWRQS